MSPNTITQFLEFRKYIPLQGVPFLLQITEGGADKNSECLV